MQGAPVDARMQAGGTNPWEQQDLRGPGYCGGRAEVLLRHCWLESPHSPAGPHRELGRLPGGRHPNWDGAVQAPIVGKQLVSLDGTGTTWALGTLKIDQPRTPSKAKPHIEENCWDSIQIERSRGTWGRAAQVPMKGRNRASRRHGAMLFNTLW